MVRVPRHRIPSIDLGFGTLAERMLGCCRHLTRAVFLLRYETAGGKAMAPGVRMKQLAWRDKVSVAAVLCRLRVGTGRGDSKAGAERKPCEPPMTVSMTKQEWDVAMGAKKDSEAADRAIRPVQGRGEQTSPKKKKKRGR